MPIGTEEGGSVALSDFVGQMSGDIRSEPDESAATAGESPTESASETPSVPEGTEPVERAGDTPVVAAAPAPETVTEPDPLAEAKPLTYTVNGETRSYEGIKLLGEDGAIIRPADLPDVMKRLGERDHYFEQSQQQYRAVQHYEKLAEWKTTDAEGKEQTFTGHHGIVERTVDSARKDAAFAVIDALFADPAKFASLVAVDDKNQIVVDPRAYEYLQKDVRLAANDAERQARASLVGLVAEMNRPQVQAINYAAVAPRVIEQAAGQDFTKLTAEDKALLAEQMPQYVRDTTPEEKRAGQGEKIVDARFISLVQRFAKHGASLAQVATTTATATKENAARLAAAARGKPQAPSKPAPAKKPPTEAETRASEDEAVWDAREKAAAAGIRRRSA